MREKITELYGSIKPFLKARGVVPLILSDTETMTCSAVISAYCFRILLICKIYMSHVPAGNADTNANSHILD